MCRTTKTQRARCGGTPSRWRQLLKDRHKSVETHFGRMGSPWPSLTANQQANKLLAGHAWPDPIPFRQMGTNVQPLDGLVITAQQLSCLFVLTKNVSLTVLVFWGSHSGLHQQGWSEMRIGDGSMGSEWHWSPKCCSQAIANNLGSQVMGSW